MDALVIFAIASLVVLGPLVVLAFLADRFGIDSRPSISDRDQRPWLVPTN